MTKNSENHSQLYPQSLDIYKLNRLKQEHAKAFFAFISKNRAHLEKYDPFVSQFQNLKDVEEALRQIQDYYDNGISLSCGIWEKNSLIGYFICGLDLETKSMECGYGLAQKYQGRGIITRTAQIILRYAFEELGMNYAWLTCWTNNAPSIKVAERLGFRQDQEVILANEGKGILHDQYRYKLLRPS